MLLLPLVVSNQQTWSKVTGDRQVLCFSISLNLSPSWILILDEISKSCLCGLISHLKDTKCISYLLHCCGRHVQKWIKHRQPFFLILYMTKTSSGQIEAWGKWNENYLKNIMSISAFGLWITLQKKVRKKPSLCWHILNKKQDKQRECLSTKEQRDN